MRMVQEQQVVVLHPLDGEHRRPPVSMGKAWPRALHPALVVRKHADGFDTSE